MHTTTFEFPVIEGLDWNYARIHFHDEEALLDTVTFFVESIDYDAFELDNLFTAIGTDDGNRSYCTKVHSMKNSAATIGIIPLAGMAKMLEDSARNHDTETLKALHSIFLACWRSYTEKLSAFTKAFDTNDKKSSLEYQSEIDSLLQQVKNAAEEMDIDALDQLGEQLDNYQFPEEQQEFINQIHHAILDFDVDFLQNI